MRWSGYVLLVAGFWAMPAPAQWDWEPFGVDVEGIGVGDCYYTTYRADAHGAGFGYCPQLEKAARAGVQWVRLFAIWNFLEYHQGKFDFYILDYLVDYALRKGMKVYITATWAPKWANGSVCSRCAPIDPDNCGDTGKTVLSASYTYEFFYQLATHYRDRVQFYGAWNEPNNSCNFDARNVSADPGSYLNVYVERYLAPARRAIKAADPAAFLVGPELQEGNVSCGGWQSCDWYRSWMEPLWRHFRDQFDVISFHAYKSSHEEVSRLMDRVDRLVGREKPVWLTEGGYNEDTSADGAGEDQLRQTYVDLFNRSSWWRKYFYSFLTDATDTPAEARKALLSPEPHLSEKRAYWSYKRLTGR